MDLEALMDSKEAVVEDIARIIRLMEVMHSKCLNKCLVEVTLEDLEAAAEAERLERERIDAIEREKQNITYFAYSQAVLFGPHFPSLPLTGVFEDHPFPASSKEARAAFT